MRGAEPSVTRPKTISDQELLAVARRIFREHGRTASTRAIAREAGISEGILYQRFGSKEGLFFAAMAPRAPDIEALFGAEPPVEEVSAFVTNVVVRMAKYFADVIPLAIQVITHPGAPGPGVEHAQSALGELHKALVSRLAWFERHKLVRPSTAKRTAQLLMSLAHDWAISHAGFHPGGKHSTKELEEMADIVCRGIRRGEG
jgi:AcrR family transcriptional regulator